MKIQIEVEADYLVEEIVKQLKQSERIVEVVRCKDCIFFNSTWGVCNLLERVREKDGYCSIAKKKGETNDRITNNL